MIDPNKPAHIRAAEQPAQQKCDSDALVMIPRGLIGAACYAINKKRDAPKLLEELRRYTVGDLSDAAQPAQRQPLTRAQIREVFMAHGFTIKEGQTDLKEYVYDAAYALLAAAHGIKEGA